MNKEIIVMLLRKDMEELMMLTAGFESMSEYPESILQLAINKGEDILSNLKRLKSNSFVAPAVSEGGLEEQVAETVSNVEFTVDNSQYEEFQEEIEVDEISELEQVLSLRNQKLEVVEELRKFKENAEVQTVNEQLIADTPTVNSLIDKLATQPVESLGDNLAKQKIQDVKQAMTVADRFRFQRELFDGSGEAMNKALSHLNGLTSLEAASKYLFAKNNWDAESPIVQDFLELINKRY